MKSRRINVIYADNGSGLSRDAVVMNEALTLAGHRVWLTPRPPRRFPLAVNYAPELARQALRCTTQKVVKAWARRTRFWDVNIFLESLVPEYFECARVNCLLPNEEWLTDGDRKLMGAIDLVLFKTRHARQVLESETKESAFIGFTSLDRRDCRVAPRWNAALHVSGWNPLKGTAAVTQAWARHPEWPRVTLVTQHKAMPPHGPNIDVITRRISDRQLRQLQNACAVNVCPSEVEGFGHTLMEALSCGSVIVTTDAPPMDELVSAEEGFLVPHTASVPSRAGTPYFVDVDGLADVLARVWTDGASELRCRRSAARAKYERMTESFHYRFAQVMQGV